MPAGRPRKPAPLRIIEGNRGNRPIPKEAKIGGGDCPRRPQHLLGMARTKWEQLAPDLHTAGLLTTADADALASYCVAYQEWRECTALVKREGRTFVTIRGVRGIRPELKIAHKAQAIMQQLMSQFGLSPKARANLGTAGTPKEIEDPFSAIGGA